MGREGGGEGGEGGEENGERGGEDRDSIYTFSILDPYTCLMRDEKEGRKVKHKKAKQHSTPNAVLRKMSMYMYSFRY